MATMIPIIDIFAKAYGITEQGFHPLRKKPGDPIGAGVHDDMDDAARAYASVRRLHRKEPLYGEPPTMSDEIVRIIDGCIQEAGIDVLAFYLPYHASPKHWGIYYWDHSFPYLMRKMSPFDPGWNHQTSWRFLYEHEIFHCRTEMAFSQIEAITGTTAYALRRERPHNVIEEGLANAHVLRRREFNKKHVRRFMLQQPAGYRDFGQYKDFISGLDGFVKKYVPAIACGSVFFDIGKTPGMAAIDLDGVPEYEISWKTLQVSDLALMVRPVDVVEGAGLRASLERRQLTDRWDKQRGIIGEVGLRHPSLDFEKHRPGN